MAAFCVLTYFVVYLIVDIYLFTAVGFQPAVADLYKNRKETAQKEKRCTKQYKNTIQQNGKQKYRTKNKKQTQNDVLALDVGGSVFEP
jgi:hypothetical protein